METKDLEFLADISEKREWEEMRKDVLMRLKNDYILINQRLAILARAEEYLKKFPEEEDPAPEAEEAVEELEEMAKE